MENGDESKRNDLARKNIRLAIALGLFALGVYLYFILSFTSHR